MRLTFALFLSLVSLVAGNTATCGKTQYSSDALSKAADGACSLLQKGSTVGRNNYPHEYKNFEKIKLTGSAPWYEFPVLSNGQVYSGSGMSFSQTSSLCRRHEAKYVGFVRLTMLRFSWCGSSHHNQRLQAGRCHHAHWSHRKQFRHMRCQSITCFGNILKQPFSLCSILYSDGLCGSGLDEIGKGLDRLTTAL